jgi:hypothetical protein
MKCCRFAEYGFALQTLRRLNGRCLHGSLTAVPWVIFILLRDESIKRVRMEE